jgi:DNA repair photolyase
MRTYVRMRWDEQRVENDLRLPGVGAGTVVRTFDAPEAMGINFHEVRAKSALNYVPGGRYGFSWTINPFRGCTHACKFCFARRTHTYLNLNPDEDFEREIVVKVNVPELLRAELARPSWKRELVALGTNTDPYQWVESRYRMMPEILEALEAAETPVSVLTKSPLVMRDVEILERMAKKLPVSVNLSVPTLDEDAWRATEPHTPSPAARLDAVAELRRRGIESGVLIAPLMPGINDDPEQVRPIVERARKAGATFLGGVALHLRDEVKDVFFAWLEAKRPDLLPRYEALYQDRAYMKPEQRKRTTRAVRGWGKTRLRRSRANRPGTDGNGRLGSQARQSAPRTGGPGGDVAGGTAPEEALATAGGRGSPASTGPAGPPVRQVPLF